MSPSPARTSPARPSPAGTGPVRRSRRRPVAAAALALLAALATGGCAGMPTTGPVVETRSERDDAAASAYNYDPLPPQPGARAAEIVRGFLDAMMAAPIQVNSARQFLTQDAQAAWNPERRTITYVERSTPTGESPVSVTLPAGGDVYDARGAWQGSLPARYRKLTFDLAVEGGEWRIASAPDALLVSEEFFDQRFQRASLYFFDPTARILVPEPVYVPSGGQLATTLVKALLAGPDPRLDRVVRTFLPTGVSAGLSVPVSEDGVAQIDLGAEAGRPAVDSVRYLVSQLAWTLRQVPGVARFRLAVGGVPLRLPNGDAVFSVDAGAEFDPTALDAGADQARVFGLRDGVLVSGSPDDMSVVSGPFGSGRRPLSRVAVALDQQQAAGVTDDGRTALVAPVSAGPEAPEVVRVVAGATDLLDPAWDFAGRLWLVDRRVDGARVLYREGERTRALAVPGVTGRQVTSFLVSRDGSRLVAAVRRGRFDVLVTARLRYDEQGRVLSASRAEELMLDAGASHQVADLAWLAPTTVAALTRVAGQLWEVRTVSADGAPTSQETAATLSGPVRGLIGSPVTGQGLLVLTEAEALDLSGSVARPVEVDPEVTDLDHVG